MMKPNAMSRSRCAAIPAGLAFALLSIVVPALAAPLPEPALRASSTLTVPVAVHEVERALLRVEYHAATSAQEETDTVGEIVARTRRIEGMVADIHRLVGDWPAAEHKPVAPALSHATDQSGNDIGVFELYAMIILAAGLTFFVWLMKQRHDFLKAKKRREAAQAGRKSQPSLA